MPARRGRRQDDRGGHGPEIELILGAVGVGKGRSPEAGGELDWPLVVRTAKDHGVLGLLHRALQARGWHGVPPAAVEAMNRYRVDLTARNLFLTSRLLDVLRLLDEVGIKALPYKGALLAVLAYGEVGVRPFADLDLILSERDVLRAKARLESNGYRSAISDPDGALAKRLPRGYYALPLSSADGDVMVELHWRLSASCPLVMEDLLPAVHDVDLLGSTVPSLASEQLLVVLCIHGQKHAWERLEWTCSLAHLIDRVPDLDWSRVEAQARAVGAARAVALGLTLASRLASARVPAATMAALSTRSLPAVAAEIEARIFRETPDSPRATTRYVARLRSASLSEGVRYCLFLVHPTEKDWEFVRLPRRLAALYYVVRPIRVALEHVPRRPRR